VNLDGVLLFAGAMQRSVVPDIGYGIGMRESSLAYDRLEAVHAETIIAG
jgi:hypothetical protein